MAKSDKKILLLLIVIMFLEVFNIYNTKLYNQYVYIGFWFIALLILILAVGFSKFRSLHQKDILQQVFIYSTLYLIATYLCGLLTGFQKTGNSLQLIEVTKNLVPTIILIVIEELIRYEVTSKEKSSKFNVFFLIIAFCLFDVIVNLNKYGLNNPTSIFKTIGLIALPSLSKNVFLSFLITKGGYKSTVLYRLIAEATIFVLPIFPDFGNYIKAILNFVFPMILLVRFNKLYVKSKMEFSQSRNLLKKIVLSITVFILIVVVYLVSTLFKYYALTIGSGSMQPNLNVGDVVIVKKIPTKDLNTLKIGDILVHNFGNATIVHRIVDIEVKDSNYYFTTKGDNNPANDKYITDNGKVIGIAIFKIPYIGYPTIWLSNLIK